MLEMLDEQLLDDFANTFYGYGDYQGSYWFIGMEEGGGNLYEEINKRLLTWNQHGRNELEPINTFHQDIGIGEYFQSPPKDQRTWNRLIRIFLSASQPDEWGTKTKRDQTKAVQDYQINRLGRRPGQDCLIELLPLPSPSIGHWIYADHTNKLQFKNRKNYEEHYRTKRVLHIQQRIYQHSPAVVVFYGLKYRKYWEEIVGATISRNPTYGIHILKKNATVFVIIRHPAREQSYAYFHEVGRQIALLREK